MLALFLLLLFQASDSKPAAAWSPDHQVQATTKVDDRFVTPEGATYKVLLDGKPVYPERKKTHWFSGYENQHTLLSEVEWSPDSQRLAFVEKVYNWEYEDPYNRDFEGRVSKERYYLVVLSRTGVAARYAISRPQERPELRWNAPEEMVLSGRTFDLLSNPPPALR